MKVRWLGWAGVEIEVDGASLVIDPLADPGAIFAALGDRATAVEWPIVRSPDARGTAIAGLVSHLHRDHADAGALAGALDRSATVYEPLWPGGTEAENRSLAQANAELERVELNRRPVEVWEQIDIGPFAITALPAVDGVGDPQVSWLVEAGGQRVVHLGDTMFHGFWWRMSRRHGPFDAVLVPINGAVVDFPHLRPASSLAAAMEPEQAALAGELLRARIVVPMHYDGFSTNPWYRPISDAARRFEVAAAGRSFEVCRLQPGESLELASAHEISDRSRGVGKEA